MAKRRFEGSFKAHGFIAYGAPVLFRGNGVQACDELIANGRAFPAERMLFRNESGGFNDGDWAAIEPIERNRKCNLQALADGPIQNPLSLFLPAGRVSEAEYRERIRSDFQRAGIER